MIIYRPFRQINSACNHSYTSRVTVQASCTTAGETTYTCSKCNDQYTVEISAYGHILTDQFKDQRCLAKPATCTADATYYYECVRCSHNTADEGTDATWTDEGSALGHAMAQYSYNNTHHWSYCTRGCGHTEDTEIHNVTSWTSTPISDTQVKLTGVCTICGQDAEHIHDINATEDCPYCGHVHNWILIGEPQREKGICTHSVRCSCGVTTTQNFDIHNHDCDYYCDGGCSWVEHTLEYKQTVPDTSDFHYIKCAVCGESFGTEDHEYNEIRQFTTADPGYDRMHAYVHRTICKCGDDGIEDHSYIDGICACGWSCTHADASDATCTDPSVCNNCGAEVNQPLGHELTGSPTLIETITPYTCTENGWGVWEGPCANCGELVTVEAKIAAPGHDWEAATCITPKTCTRCGATEGVALGHNTYHRNRSESTCVYAGYEAHDVCQRCYNYLQNGQIVTAEDIMLPLADHTWRLVSDTATCTAGGVKTYKCAYETLGGCTATKTEVSPAKGHTPGPEATCTTDQICTICNTVLTLALGHDYTNLQLLPCSPKCYTKTCSRCSNVYTHLDPKCNGPHIK